MLLFELIGLCELTPLLSGQLAISRGWPLNRGLTVHVLPHQGMDNDWSGFIHLWGNQNLLITSIMSSYSDDLLPGVSPVNVFCCPVKCYTFWSRQTWQKMFECYIQLVWNRFSLSKQISPFQGAQYSCCKSWDKFVKTGPKVFKPTNFWPFTLTYNLISYNRVGMTRNHFQVKQI